MIVVLGVTLFPTLLLLPSVMRDVRLVCVLHQISRYVCLSFSMFLSDIVEVTC